MKYNFKAISAERHRKWIFDWVNYSYLKTDDRIVHVTFEMLHELGGTVVPETTFCIGPYRVKVVSFDKTIYVTTCVKISSPIEDFARKIALRISQLSSSAFQNLTNALCTSRS